MNRKYFYFNAATVFVIVVVVIWLVQPPTQQPPTQQPPTQQPPTQRRTEHVMMTRHEAALLRSIIQKDGLQVHTKLATPLPYREIVLKADLVELHKKKRVATIKLLLDIVKGAQPEDSLTA